MFNKFDYFFLVNFIKFGNVIFVNFCKIKFYFFDFDFIFYFFNFNNCIIIIDNNINKYVLF